MRVLIADDDADVREVLVESFRDAGFDVLQAANGLEALLCVKRDRPDAVVLDLMMPRLGGVEALKRIHAFNPGIRALVVTGAIDSELHRQATLAGAAGVFAKPVSAATLVAALAGPPPAPAPRPAEPAPAAPAAPVAAAGGAPAGRVRGVDGHRHAPSRNRPGRLRRRVRVHLLRWPLGRWCNIGGPWRILSRPSTARPSRRASSRRRRRPSGPTRS